MYDQDLRDYFFFDEADLIANRNGRFSKKQLDKLTQDDQAASRFIRITGLVLTFIALIYPVIMLVKGFLAAQQAPNAPIQWSIGFTIAAIIAGAIGCYCLYIGYIDKSNTPSKFQVQKVEGAVKFVPMNSSNSSEVEYSFRIGKTKMEVVDHALTELIKEGDKYSVYFYDPSNGTGNQILSLESASKE